eukprot:06837_4
MLYESTAPPSGGPRTLPNFVLPSGVRNTTISSFLKMLWAEKANSPSTQSRGISCPTVMRPLRAASWVCRLTSGMEFAPPFTAVARGMSLLSPARHDRLVPSGPPTHCMFRRRFSALILVGSQSAGCQKQPFFASPRWSRPPVVVRDEQKLKPAIGLTALPSQQTTRKMQNAHTLARHMCVFLAASTRRSRSVVRADSICLSSDNQNFLNRWPRPRMPSTCVAPRPALQQLLLLFMTTFDCDAPRPFSDCLRTS